MTVDRELRLNGPALLDVYRRLHGRRGDLGWWPGETPLEVMIGAVLTQNTSWSNVERAIANLKTETSLELERILWLPPQRLEELVRPSGYYRIKARRLRNLLEFVGRSGGLDGLAKLDTHELRQRLLEVNGVGPETADSILLYAFGRPVFVVDAYTRRLFQRLGFFDVQPDYETLRLAIERVVPRDVKLYNDFHAQIVIHCKDVCRKNPNCSVCVLCPLCVWAGTK